MVARQAANALAALTGVAVFSFAETPLAEAANHRSRAVRAEFMRQAPCPSTGATRGACPGYQVDHRTPLCIGGADRVDNLQWLSVEAHRAKTRSDVRLCRTHP